MKATKQEINHIEKLYEGRKAYHGELHDHAATGGTSDGTRTLEHWKGAMEALKLDFAAILDHKQVKHMYIPQWEDGLFLGGTEPGTVIVDAEAEIKKMHYNMLFENAEPLMDLLNEFKEFEFTGGPEGHFEYPTFTRERFSELAEAVFAHGGFFVHPHPTILMNATDPLQYCFRERMGIEVFYSSMQSDYTKDCYKLWCDILATGYKIYATAGCDHHACCSDGALTTIYADEKRNAAYIKRLREGDFICGPVGIKMCIGEVRMGGDAIFGEENLVVGVSDFHKCVFIPEHKYRLDIIDDAGIVKSFKFSCDKPFYASVKTKKSAKFYRAEVTDLSRDLRIAVGNPIWNKEN